MDFTFFNQLMLILSLSVVTIAFFKRFNLPESIGYLFVGILLAPSTTGLIESDFDIALLAEIGVVFLLFTLGLEFSMKTMMAMKREVFGIGGLQVLLTTTGIFALLQFFGFPVVVSLVTAAALALSSTAIVSKELTQRNEIKSRQGQLAISVLLFQDIAAVVFLILIPAISGGTDQSILSSLSISFLKGFAFVAAMMAAGRWLIPRIFHEVARARSEELFVLMALVLALMAAWLTHTLGLSMALGGFVAGMMLGESNYKHQVEADIKPFRDVLLGLFFVSVGLMINMTILIQFWPVILIATFVLISFKFSIIYCLARINKEEQETSIKTSLSLAQGGEFCFALIALASQYGQTGGDLSSIILAVTILSMICAPLLIRNSQKLSSLVTTRKNRNIEKDQSENEEVQKQTAHIHHHTLICGFGRVGQTIARFLTQEGKPYIAIDDDPLHVHEAGLAGDPVFYGDCKKIELLRAVGLERASQVIICIDRSDSALEILKIIRNEYKEVPILVRTRDDSMTPRLKEAGATVIIPEVLESSLLIVKHVLLMLGIDPHLVRRRVNQAREQRYEILNGYYPGINDFLMEQDDNAHRHAVTITENSKASTCCVEELDLSDCDVSVVEVRRNNMVLQPQPAMKLSEGDIIILTGESSSIAKAEKKLK